MSYWCDACSKRATRRILASSGAFPNSYYCEECYEKRLLTTEAALQRPTPEPVLGTPSTSEDGPACPPPEEEK